MTVLPKTKKALVKERSVQPGTSSCTTSDRRPPSPTNRKTRRNLSDVPSTSAPPPKKGYRSRSGSPGINSDDERTPGFRDEQLELQFADRLRASHGWQIKQMQGDGACLFRAVADQVYGDEEMHGEVRRLCMDYMERNRDHFAEFVTEDFDEYVIRKRLPQTHGNHVEIQAISEMYARPVEIYEYNDQPNNTFNPRSNAEMNAPLRLSYHGAVHYNSVVDPQTATIGVGLGLPGHVPGAADAQAVSETLIQSEMSHIEETMLHDKLHMSDWQKTEEEIKDQVARESYLQYLQSLEGKGSVKPEDAPCGSKSIPPPQMDKPCSSKQQEPKAGPGLYEELLLMGAVDFEDDDSAMVAQALLLSQQQFMEELQKKKKNHALGMEKDFGIEEYVGGFQQPIPCVLKELYTDFIVQEIRENQHVLPIRPPELDPKQENLKEKIIQKLEVSIPECISEQEMALNGFVDNLNPKQRNNFSIDVKNLTKEERTLIHKFIRERFNGSLSSEHKEDSIVVTSGNGGKNDRKRKRWDPDTPDYLHFTLAKENKDTSFALGILAKFIGVKSDLFRSCGIKDKRAVTSQRVSCYRVEKDKIINVIPKLRGFTLFDFEYKPEGLKMGGHWGNRFSIILRNIPSESKDEILSRCAIFKENGFVNYFGTQRFGSALNNTAETGKLILQRKWEEAIKNIFRTSEEMGYTTVAEAASHFRKTGDPKEALKRLKGGQQFASLESNILRALTQGKTWQQCLTEVLPMNMRSLYVHAYQSLIWNKIVSRRIREHGTTVIPEDVAQMGGSMGDKDIFSVHIPLPGSKDDIFPAYAKIWLEELLHADQLTTDSFRNLRDRFALGDSTRALLVKPGDVEYTLITYKHNRQSLQEGLLKREDREAKENTTEELLALKVQFNLPNGTYATVALRQITGFDMGKTNMMEMGKQDEDNGVADVVEVDTTSNDEQHVTESV